MQKIVITINGMSCASCANSIIKTLKAKQLLNDIHINLITKTATLALDESHSLEAIFSAIKKLGYEPESSPSSPFIPASNAAKPLATSPLTPYKPSISPPAQGRPSQSSQSFHTRDKVDSSPATMLQPTQENVSKTSINPSQRIFLTPKIQELMHLATNFIHKKRVLLSGLIALAILYLSMSPMVFDTALMTPFDDMRVNFFAQLFLALSGMHLGREYYFKGFRALFAKAPTMDSLIALSTTASLVYSVYNALLGHTHWYFESICVIVFFVLFGKGLEQNAKDTTAAVIRTLLLRNLSQVIRLESSSQTSISPQAIRIGDRLQILPAQTIPADGIITQGSCALDESMLSGEVLPVEKSVGQRVYAGSINTNRAFIMQATSTSEQSTLSALSALVQEALVSKPALARLADIIASYFVPAVIAIAFGAFLLWWAIMGVDFGFGVCIAVLVISCPCALGLATPMAVMIGTALANKQGVFIRQAQSFENLGRVSDVVFDKTGTLTNAALEVVEIRSISELDQAEILAISAGVEQGSEHIIAKAILQEAKKQGISPRDCGEFRAFAGYGIEARDTQGITYVLGAKELLQGAVDSSLDKECAYIQVFLGQRVDSSYKILGSITLQDTLKSGAQEMIEALKAKGITPHILSGDNAANTAHIARKLGITHYKAHAKPADKLAYIKALQDKGRVVLMAGDGVNDVGALAAADVSLSFAHASDVSKNTADIIIYHNDISRVLYVMRLSHKVMQNIKENLAFAFVYNCLCIPIACGVLYYPAQILLNPMLAAFAMSASSVCVVLNSQRLWRFRA